MRRREPARVLGPYQEEKRWRLIIIESGERRGVYVASHEEALKLKRQIEKELARPEARTIGDLMQEYFDHKERAGRCTRATCIAENIRVRRFLGPYVDQDISTLTARRAEALYQHAQVAPTSKTGRPLSIASQHVYLSYVKGFVRWSVQRGYIAQNPFAAVQALGKPNTGKKQLRIEEARQFFRAAIDEYRERNEPVAIGALVALLMGLRASEVLRREVRDLDDDGRLLWVDGTKSHNAKRHLRVPHALRPYLRELAAGKPAQEFLFGRNRAGKPMQRQRLNIISARICERAGVPTVCPHSLRGLYATLAVESGAVSDAVAASLGHGSFDMTERHYAQPAAVSNAKTARVEGLLAMGGAPASERDEVADVLRSLDSETLAELLRLAKQRKGTS